MPYVTNLICNRELRASDIVCTHIYQVYKDSAIDLVDPRLVEVMNFLLTVTFKDYCVLINNWSGNQSVEEMQKFPDVHYYEERGMRCNLCKSSLDRTKRGEIIIEPHILGKGVDFTVYNKDGYAEKVADNAVEEYQTVLNEDNLIPAEKVRIMIEEDAPNLPHNIRVDYSLKEWTHLDVLDTLNSTSKLLKMGNPADPEIIDGSAKYTGDNINFTIFTGPGIQICGNYLEVAKIDVKAIKISSAEIKQRIKTLISMIITGLGWTPIQAAGLCGCIYSESRFRTTAYNGPEKRGTLKSSGACNFGAAYGVKHNPWDYGAGMIQWTFTQRKENALVHGLNVSREQAKNIIQTKGIENLSFEDQVKMVIGEIKSGNYKVVNTMMKTFSTIEQSTAYIFLYYLGGSPVKKSPTSADISRKNATYNRANKTIGRDYYGERLSAAKTCLETYGG